MARLRSAISLKTLASAFWALKQKHSGQWADRKMGLVLEIAVRLEQCDLCLSKIRALERRHRASVRRMPHGSRSPTRAEWDLIRHLHARQRALTEEIWIWTEAFYHLAWRVIQVAEHQEALHWKSFSRAADVESINRVRNKLISHSEERGGVVNMNFAHGLTVGPILKWFGEGHRPQTEGLYLHAQEFASAVDQRFKKAGL